MGTGEKGRTAEVRREVCGLPLFRFPSFSPFPIFPSYTRPFTPDAPRRTLSAERTPDASVRARLLATFSALRQTQRDRRIDVGATDCPKGVTGETAPPR